MINAKCKMQKPGSAVEQALDDSLAIHD